ncbi:MAG: 6,7-dimethyl-8-ribityllumazine synthase [Solirubrobacteraceae bacterium]|jgi:6,7-dimethyl-8-ribityllumazine synthase
MDERYAIVVARFYADIADRLVASARRTFDSDGAHDVDVFEVPGAFELPLAALYVAQSGRYRGIACLGAVIRGETDHYDHVCAEAARGLQDVQLRTGVPCAFGVLTVESMDQALERSGGRKRDHGAQAAHAVLTLARLRETLES